MASSSFRAWSVGLIALVVAVAGLFLTVWRPRYQPSTQKLPSVPLPYSRVQFTVGDATGAFAAVGVRLVPKSHSPGATTIGTANDQFEVDVFGLPARVTAYGSPEVITDAHGNYVRIPSRCTPGIPAAERWRGNVRFVVPCADPEHQHLLSVGTRALANL